MSVLSSRDAEAYESLPVQIRRAVLAKRVENLQCELANAYAEILSQEAQAPLIPAPNRRDLAIELDGQVARYRKIMAALQKNQAMLEEIPEDKTDEDPSEAVEYRPRDADVHGMLGA